MLQINVTVTAPELAEAMAALATALQGAKIEGVFPPADYLPPTPAAANPTQKAPPTPATVAPIAPATTAANPAPAPAPVQPTPVTPPVVPTTAAPTYSREQIMTAGAVLIDAGKIKELTGLLNAFGVQAVTQLKPDQLGAFATELRKLGAQI